MVSMRGIDGKRQVVGASTKQRRGELLCHKHWKKGGCAGAQALRHTGTREWLKEREMGAAQYAELACWRWVDGGVAGPTATKLGAVDR